jgi:hypothetical protein
VFDEAVEKDNVCERRVGGDILPATDVVVRWENSTRNRRIHLPDGCKMELPVVLGPIRWWWWSLT